MPTSTDQFGAWAWLQDADHEYVPCPTPGCPNEMNYVYDTYCDDCQEGMNVRGEVSCDRCGQPTVGVEPAECWDCVRRRGQWDRR